MNEEPEAAGEPACLLHLLCPACGRVPDDDRTTRCAACGADLRPTDERGTT